MTHDPIRDRIWRWPGDEEVWAKRYMLRITHWARRADFALEDVLAEFSERGWGWNPGYRLESAPCRNCSAPRSVSCHRFVRTCDLCRSPTFVPAAGMRDRSYEEELEASLGRRWEEAGDLREPLDRVELLCPHCGDPIASPHSSMFWSRAILIEREQVNCDWCGNEVFVPPPAVLRRYRSLAALKARPGSSGSEGADTSAW